MSTLKNLRASQRFSPLKQKISELKKNNTRFKKVYREYEIMSEEQWNLETSPEISVSDDFLDAVNVQTRYLEDEIEVWLHPDEENKTV
ncbi:hypothetical protein [Halpernia sp.]|uniref:hypothetical protein n=1 Tax=Halpernia sp. TaxID=2782209 RepID=UPI003A90A8E3